MRAPLPLLRLGYRVAYAVLQVYYFFRRPPLRGVKCVLTHDNQVLLVRHTYGTRTWDLPGGAIRRGEPPVETARREMAEELGVKVRDWRALAEVPIRIDRRRGSVHSFHAELSSRELEIRLAEIAEARWFPRDALPKPLSRYVTPVLVRLEP